MESPESFFRWASYCTLSAVLRNNVWIEQGLKKIWPNIYTILIARSAALRKSVPVDLAGDLIADSGCTKVIRGRSSIQAVVRELGGMDTNRETGQTLAGASGILIAGELASFSPDDPATIPLLTDLYDNHKNWSSHLVSTSKVSLKDTCLSMLAASNEPFFREVYTSLAVRGGLLGRTFIVRETEKRKVNSLMYLDYEDPEALRKYLESRYDRAPLVARLKNVARLRGAVFITYEARQEYNSWYIGFDQSKFLIGETGISERIHTGVLKLALLLAVGEDTVLEIRKHHIEEAIERCTALLKNYEVITMSSGKSEQAEPSAIFLAFLYERHGKASHKDVLRFNFMHFNSETLKGIVETLTQAGLVGETLNSTEPTYFLTEKGKAIFGG